jgi:isocitrate dehydrogenase
MASPTLDNPIPVTLARGDGIGPEITDAVLRILTAAEAPLRYDEIEIGEQVYRAGHSSGIAPETWEIICRNPAFLKAPITTPLGGGYKSLNVTIRKTLNLYANVRPTKSYAPFVASAHPGIDLVIVRENEEDLYAGIEHQQTSEVTQVLKLITRPGSERIVRYAFEYARAYGRRKVTCMTKNNIMKLTDGLFERVFQKVAAEYPDIESDHQIIDIGAARLAAQPEIFDVVVTLNLYGDILSDIASQISGSVGIAGSANIGAGIAMFEAVHGSAPDIAGKNVANPSGLLVAATQLLVHVGAAEVAERIKNAWLVTLEDGVHTPDIYRDGLSAERAGTQLFADAVISRLGETPRHLSPVAYQTTGISVDVESSEPSSKQLVGVDAFLDWHEADRDPEVLGSALATAAAEGWVLEMVTNRGVKVYPGGIPETFCTDHWRCRFVPGDADIDNGDIVRLLTSLHDAGFDVIKTENLYRIDGEIAYSLGQGE